MSDTSAVKVYLLKSNTSIEDFRKYLIEEHKYYEMKTKEDIQERYNIKIMFFFHHTKNNPVWYEFIKGYFYRLDEFRFENHSFIGLIEDIESKHIYVICGGGGAYIIPKYIELNFGIEILERVFDPDKNKIDKVNDRQIIGDILASSRYYRRSRSLAYEDDFGKYLQAINVKLDKEQIKTFFPALAEYKGDKLAKQITIVGASSFEISSRVNFVVFIGVLKDISKLLNTPTISIFNKSLIPINEKTSKEQIKLLQSGIIENLINYVKGVSSLDIDICYTNFEDFYFSSKYFLFIPEITLLPNIKGSTGESVGKFRYKQGECRVEIRST